MTGKRVTFAFDNGPTSGAADAGPMAGRRPFQQRRVPSGELIGRHEEETMSTSVGREGAELGFLQLSSYSLDEYLNVKAVWIRTDV